MPTERTPLREGENIPPYVFITNHHRSYKNKVRRFQCCFCAALLLPSSEANSVATATIKSEDGIITETAVTTEFVSFEAVCKGSFPIVSGSVFVTALVITISYTVNEDIEDFNATEATNNLPPSDDPVLNTLLSLSFPLADKPYSKWDDPPNDTEVAGAFAEGQKSLLLKEAFEEKVPTLSLESPSYKHQMATRTLPKARELSKTGHIMEAATLHLAKKSGKSGRKDIGRGPTLQVDWLPKEVCSEDVTNPCTSSRYRTADGSCNNLVHPRSWGVAMRPFRRIMPPDYGDGVSHPRKSSGGEKLPSARDVSLTVHRPVYRDDPNFTVMLAVWGQFIDHDITATALSQGKGGSAISCCNGYQAGLTSHPECFTVSLDSPDPYYEQYNVSCMEFVRSSPAPVCSFGPREQLNQATSYLDGSVVYGTTTEVMNQLRTFQGGELKMLISPDGAELLPVSTDTSDGCNVDEELKKGRYCFLSGDPRSNENIHLTTMHLLLARQHNLIVRKLAEINPDWDDEKLFQEGRKVVTAQLQHITYNEFLPVILGPRLMEKTRLSPRSSGYYETYDSNVDPSIANSFASSAFRFGHTLLPGLVRMIKGDNSSEEFVEMHKMLFNPFQLYDKGFLEKAVRGAVNTPVERADTYFNSEFTEKLFERKPSVGLPKGMCGLDLVSLNVQRGRDHGLPAYPAWREHCGLERPKSFDDLEGHLDAGSLERMKQIYKTVDDVDMYTGALAEKPLEGSLVGPTVTCMLTDQFLRLQRGDRYWYETSEQPQAFTPEQLNSIRQTTLAKIICDTSGLEQIQPYVMKTKDDTNKRTSCSDLTSLNLEAWKDPARVKVDPPSKIWIIRSTAPKSPRVLKIGGVVTGGSLTSEGTTVWSGALPLRIPARPLDAVSDTADTTVLPYPPVFAHGILWSGTLSASTGSARIDGKYSLPRYVRGPEGLSIKWYNGDFSLDIQLNWNSSAEDTITLSGNYSTPLYFNSRYDFATLKNASLNDPVASSLSSDFPIQSPNGSASPLILLGTFSEDGESFLWSGNVTVIVPLPPPEIPPVEQPTLQLAYTPRSYVKNVKIGGSVTGGSISAQSSTVWNGGFPVAIPVDPFDTVAEFDASTDESVVYPGHGINWRGSILSNAPGKATLSGKFSLPRFVHSNGIVPFSIHWYNGDLSVDLDVTWQSVLDPVLSLDGTFTSPVYFGDRWQFHNLRNVTPEFSFENLDIGYAGSPTQYENGLKAPLILLGTYSYDRKLFLWSGNITLIVPQVIPIPGPTAQTTLTKSAASNTPKVRVPLRLVGGQVNVDGWNVWYNNLPLGFPINSFDSVATVGEEPVDRPIVYGHGILWNGTVSTIDSNYIKIHGTFSFPKFVHSNHLSNNFSLSWLNGDFDLQFQANKTFSLSGYFTSSVYFAERPTFDILKDGSVNRFASLSGLGIGRTDLPNVLFGDPEQYPSAPLILFGAYSLDRTEFLWSGDCILVAPQLPNSFAVLKASAPKTSVSNVKLGGDVKTVSVFIDGVKVPGLSKPPLTIPTDILNSVLSSASTDSEPPAYAQEILWHGTLKNNPKDSTTLDISGNFSLPTTSNETLSWYNGNFSISIDVAWQSSNESITESYSSPVYFQNTKSKETLLVRSFKSVDFNTSTNPLVSPDVLGSAPIILSGTLSADKSLFYWSGGLTLILPTSPSLLLNAEPPGTSVSRLSVSAFVAGGSITLSGSTLWLGNRIPLKIPVKPFDSVVSELDSTVNVAPTYGHGISWKGFVSSDAPGSLKVWGSYSLPQFLHGNGTKDFSINWYNGDFAFEFKLIWDTTTNVNLQGIYSSKIFFQEREYSPPLSGEWELTPVEPTPSLVPSISPNETTSFASLILLGNYSPDRTSFIWSGNVTFIVANNTLMAD